MHSDVWFGLAWGSFPLIVGAYAQHWTLPPAALIGTVFAFFMSMGQRSLSTPARALRRRVARVDGNITMHDGSERGLDAAVMLEPLERALSTLSWAMVALALAFLTSRVF
jgi:hypothetical protein